MTTLPARFAWSASAALGRALTVTLAGLAVASTWQQPAHAAGTNLLLNANFKAGTAGWTGFNLTDGRPLLNLFVNEAGELELLGRWDRCAVGDPPSCKQLPASPLISQSLTLTAGVYRFSWHQRNQAQGNWPTQGFDVRILAPGEGLYAVDPATGYWTRVKPDKKGAIWVKDRTTGLYGNAPDRSYSFQFEVPQDGTYTVHLGLDNAGNNVDTSSGGYLYDRVWISKLRLSRVCPPDQPAC